MTTMPKVKTFLASEVAANGGISSPPQTGDLQAMVFAVNQNLVHAIDLRSRNRQMHWNAKSGGFYFMHKTFDKFADELDSIAGELGERVKVLGGRTTGMIGEVAQLSRLPVHPADAQRADDHLEELIAAYDTANRYCDAALKQAMRADHHVTAAILTGFARLLEEHRAHFAAFAEPAKIIQAKQTAA